MKKFRFLVKYGLKKRLYRKAFLISNIFVFLGIVLLMNITNIINLFKSSDVTPNEVLEVYVVDESNKVGFITYIEDSLNNNLSGATYNLTIKAASEYPNEDKADEYFEKNKIISFFKIQSNDDLKSINIYTYDYSSDASFSSLLHNAVEDARKNIILDENGLLSPLSPVLIQSKGPTIGLSPEALGGITSILMMPLFMLVIMATQMVGVDIIEEKSTKAIETIISSVPAKTHFLSKITSISVFILVQFLLLLAYAGVSALISSLFTSSSGGVDSNQLFVFINEIFPNWPLLILFVLIFTVIGTIFYLIVAALFASMATTQEDYQQFQTPIMLVLLSGFFIGMYVPMFGGSNTILAIFSYIPIFSPMVAPTAFALGALNWWQMCIVIVVQILFNVFLAYIAAPIYRISILSYDQRKFGQRVKSIISKAFPKKSKKI